jgi:hypothetical protein
VLGLLLMAAGVLMLVFRRQLYDHQVAFFRKPTRGGFTDVVNNVGGPIVLIVFGAIMVIGTLLGR